VGPTPLPVPRAAAASGGREEALVLAEGTPAPAVPLRWPVRGGILLLAGLLLRRILR
jgi:hypothetical protein